METNYDYEIKIPPENRKRVGSLQKSKVQVSRVFDMKSQKKRQALRRESRAKRKMCLCHKKHSLSGKSIQSGDVKDEEDFVGITKHQHLDNYCLSSSPPVDQQQRLSATSSTTNRRTSQGKNSPNGIRRVFRNVFRLKMVRSALQWLLLLCLASCGAVFVGKVFTDVQEQFPAQLFDSAILKEVRLRPVSLTDFRKQLSQTKSYYDLLRIFFDRKSISNQEIDELLTARTLKRVPGHVYLREVSSIDDNADDDYPLYGDYALQDPGSSVMEDLLKAYDHIEEMENSPLGQCRYPQPEIIHITGEGDSKNKLFFPECTVVHRCRNVSGCCHNASEACGPKSIEVITKSFFVIEMTGQDLVQPDEGRMVETRDFINHTECACLEIKGLPGCKKECPFPFVRVRPGMKCACDCKDENESCIDIKQGIKPLDEEMLMGIKDNTYMVPTCEEGEFDVKSGYCQHPVFTRTHRRRHNHHRARSRGQHNSRHSKNRKRTQKENRQINS